MSSVETKPYGVDAFELAPGEVGITLSYLADAVQVWSFLQPSGTSVGDAARVFNVTPAAIVAAVDAHYFMFLSGPNDEPEKQIIEHEGE